MLRPDRTLKAVTRARQHDWKIAVLTGAISIAALVAGSAFGDVHGHRVNPRVIVWTSAAALLIFGVICVRRVAAGLGHLITTRAMAAAGAAVRLIVSAVGYIVIICAELGMLDVSVEHLLVGAGLAGIVLGIAAQQSLSNVFASIVLLLAQPFTVGDHIRIRSGALGGVFDAVVLSLSLTYVTIRTDDGILKIPNSAMLAAAVGPLSPRQEALAAEARAGEAGGEPQSGTLQSSPTFSSEGEPGQGVL